MQILTAALLILIARSDFRLSDLLPRAGTFPAGQGLLGVRVNEFALGMGPKLFGFRRRGRPSTVLRLLPIGGYCAMEGEDEDSGDPRAFGNKPVWKRFLVVAAGSVFNIVLGFFLMMICFRASRTCSPLRKSPALPRAPLCRLPAPRWGMTIVEVDGYAIYTDRDLNFALVLADPAAVSMVVERDGQRVDLWHLCL